MHSPGIGFFSFIIVLSTVICIVANHSGVLHPFSLMYSALVSEHNNVDFLNSWWAFGLLPFLDLPNNTVTNLVPSQEATCRASLGHVARGGIAGPPGVLMSDFLRKMCQRLFRISWPMPPRGR